MRLGIRPLSDALGAEILGADMTQWQDDAQYSAVRQALLDYGIVVLRDQDITPDAQIAFSRRFGPLELHSMVPCRMPEHPEILLVSNRRDSTGAFVGLPDAGRAWHSDSNFNEKPSLGSLLYALEVPPQGGDTLFANMSAAYEALDAEFKAEIDGCEVHQVYRSRSAEKSDAPLQVMMTDAQWDAIPEAIHPLVRTHPETGRKSIYISMTTCDGIVGLDRAESERLTARLEAHFTRPEFVYRHQWRRHDVVFWDNRCVNHCATPFDETYTRHMHRTTIAGDKPF